MTPSARLVAAAERADEVTDGWGRVLSVRRLGPLDKLRLFRAAGAVLALNQAWLGMAVLACSVTAIDGVPVPMPASEAQIEALVARLDEAGLAAVAGTLEPAAAVDRDLAKN